jgi:hypothetical protein
MSSGMGWVMGMIGSVVMLFAGVVCILILGDSELAPLAWMFVVVGGLLLVANLAIRRRVL